MRRVGLWLFVAIGLVVGAEALRADEAKEIAAINAASMALDKAFEEKDVEKIRSLTMPNHVAIAPFYGKPIGLNEQLGSLDEMEISIRSASDINVSFLGPDVAVRTATVEEQGTYKGKPIPPRVIATETMVKRDGKWLEFLYQLTAMAD